MTFKSIILGGAAAVALTCGGFVAQGLAQTQPAPDATSSMSSDDASKTTVHHVHYHYYYHHNRSHWARYHSSTSERAETARLNQEQLARAQSGQQGQYGTMAPTPAVPDNTPQPPPPDNTPKPQK